MSLEVSRESISIGWLIYRRILRLTAVRKWITDVRVVREEQRDASGRPDYAARHRSVSRPLIITPLP